jgi:putative ABC transport system permease protein
LATRQGLKLAGGFSVLLALFVILNTFLMNVGERRGQLAILRAVGATRGQVSRLLLAECLMLGSLGTVLGILVGFGGAHLLNHALNRILQIPLPATTVAVSPLLWAIGLGIGASCLGALLPVLWASRVSPQEGLGHAPQASSHGGSRQTAILGGFVTLISAVAAPACILGWLPLESAVFIIIGLLIGIALLLSPLLGPLSQWVVVLLAAIIPAEAILARRQILRHRIRSALTVGVLFVAGSTGAGMAGSMLDNVRDIQRWYRQALVGDFFVQAMMPDMNDARSANIPDAVGEEIRKIPGIANLDTSRFLRARAAGLDVVVIAEQYTAAEPGSFDLRAGDPQTLRSRLFAGEVVIGTVLARKTGLGLGDRLPLETRRGTKLLRIAGLTNEYLVGGLAVYMHRSLAERLFDLKGVDVYVIRGDARVLPQLERQLRVVCDRNGVLLHSFAEIARTIDNMCNGVQGYLWGILVLGFVVAAFGVVNTLTMNVLEQTRELGLLRIVAMTRGQVHRTILAQALIFGILGLLPGALAGQGMAYLMHLAMMPALGHPVEYVFRPSLLLGGPLAGLAVVLLSACLPARRAGRLELLRALQYE